MKNLSKNKWIAALVILMASSALASVSSVQTPEDKILAKGFSAYMDGKDKDALSYFEEVVRLNPHNKAAQRGLDKVKVRLRKKDDIARAQNKKLADAKMKEGRNLLHSGDTIAAIDSFHAAADAIPDHAGAAAELKKIRKETESVLTKKNFNPSEWAFRRGTLAYLDRDWAKAYRIWSERQQVEPANVPLANASARAENNFKHMMVSEQEDFFRRSARAFYEQGLYQQAVNSWAKVIELRTDDVEAMQGKARSEEAVLRVAGKNKNSEMQALLEEALNYYANQHWTQALETFKKINEMDPEFSAAGEYISKINATLAAAPYVPGVANGNGNWRPAQPSAPAGTPMVSVPAGMDNFTERRQALESQQKRDPSNIRVQQELDKVVKMQDDESERIYKDGLIAYSQGNRSIAIEKWKQVLIVNPDHKKAEAALRKARAEEDRTSKEETQ